MPEILATCQDAAKLMGQPAPTSIYSSSDSFAKELGAIANEAAAAIMKQHDWRLLTTLKTHTGDDATTAFDLASDYDRMPVKGSIYRTSTVRPMRVINDLDVWLENRLRSITDPVGECIFLGGYLQIYPVLSASDSAKYYYQANTYAADSGGTAKARFTSDTDVFRLPRITVGDEEGAAEHMLKLQIIWRWRSMKGLDYAEDMQNAEIALAQEIARDKGSRVIKVGTPRLPGDVLPAYPGTISA